MDRKAEIRFQKIASQNKLAALRLELTKEAIVLYRLAPEGSDMAKECMKLVEVLAKKEWGQDTEVLFECDVFRIINGSKEENL